MNNAYESKITISCVSRLSNSGAITYVCRLGFGNFESHIHSPELISASLAALNNMGNSVLLLISLRLAMHENQRRMTRMMFFEMPLC